jgi:hypothetical protein
MLLRNAARERGYDLPPDALQILREGGEPYRKPELWREIEGAAGKSQELLQKAHHEPVSGRICRR